MRRGIGVGAVKQQQKDQAHFATKRKEVESVKLAVVQTLLSDFRTHLQEFAVKHRGRINSDPEFRRDFHQLCVTTGVDPLASSKGLFADVLGLGQFYFELGVGVVEICMKTRSRNGGVIPVHHVTAALNAGRKGQQHAVADTDVVRAVEKLAVLGNGYRILLQGNGAALIVSVPLELNRDHEELLAAASTPTTPSGHGHDHDNNSSGGGGGGKGGGSDRGYVTEAMFTHPTWGQREPWPRERFHRALYPLLQDGVVWLDDHRGSMRYYFPSLVVR